MLLKFVLLFYQVYTHPFFSFKYSILKKFNKLSIATILQFSIEKTILSLCM